MKRALPFLLLLLSLAGCTTHVLNEHRDAAFQGKFTSLTVVWVDNPVVTGQISKTQRGSAPIISEKEKQSAREGVPVVVAVLREGVPAALEPMLKARGIEVNQPSAQGVLRVTPQSGFTDCTPLACQHSLIVSVTLNEKTGIKPVWSGSFKVGAPWPADHTAETAKNFYSTVVHKLTVEKLVN
jgi:hypothetical protein